MPDLRIESLRARLALALSMASVVSGIADAKASLKSNTDGGGGSQATHFDSYSANLSQEGALP